MLGNIIAVLSLILLNSFFAAVETAILAMNGNIGMFENLSERKAKLLAKILEDKERFHTTIQVKITFIGLFSGIFAAEAFSNELILFAVKIFKELSQGTLRNIIIVIVTLVVTYFSIVLGKLVPKNLAIRHAQKIAGFSAGLMYFFFIILKPCVFVLTASSNLILRLMGVDPDKKISAVTEDEIKKLLDESEESGSIDETEKEMINNVFEFDNLSVDDISVHRTDIVALSADASRDEIIRVLTTEHFSRIPVYEESIDNIIGVLHVRDFLNYIVLPENYGKDTIDLKSLLRKPFFVPIYKKTDELFDEMQKAKSHFAVVVDEYGGTAGIVTMENLIEEIMGSILDEYDEEEKPEIEEVDSNTYIINGTADLENVAEHLDAKLPYDDYDTVSGFVIGQIGRIPEENEHPEFEYEGLIFKVLKVEDKRVTYVIVNKIL